MASFYVENFGCRAARADGEAVSSRLRADGFATATAGDASVVIVNTCSVTAEADRDARAFIRKTLRANPEAKVVVTGCYAQRAPEEIAGLKGVAAVVGNSHKGLLPEIVGGLVGRGHEPTVSRPPVSRPPVSGKVGSGKLDSGQVNSGQANSGQPNSGQVIPVWVDDRFAHSYIENAQVMPGLAFAPDTQTRPNLKIQEGCGNRCTFCVIPTTRGASRSLAAQQVLQQVHGFVAAGGNELVVSGINLGRWGQELEGRPSLASLLRRVLDETGLARLRLSSIEPMDWTRELIDLIAEHGGGRIARHAHLPLQSGSDAVLRRMHRRYRPWHYQQKVDELLAAVGPGLALGADVMVGFPGETDAEFRQTYDLVADLPFAYLHLFPFSPRPGTPGWELHRKSPVNPAVVQQRMAALRDLAREQTQRFRSSFLGKRLQAITLQTPAGLAASGRSSALTENFLPIELDQPLPANRLVDVTISRVNDSGVLLGSTNLLASQVAVAS